MKSRESTPEEVKAIDEAVKQYGPAPASYQASDGTWFVWGWHLHRNFDGSIFATPGGWDTMVPE